MKKKLPIKLPPEKLPHVQRSVGDLDRRTSAERRAGQQGRRKDVVQSEGRRNCFGNRAGARTTHGYLASEDKQASQQNKTRAHAGKDATVKLDVTLGKLTHPPFGRARPKKTQRTEN